MKTFVRISRKHLVVEYIAVTGTLIYIWFVGVNFTRRPNQYKPKNSEY